MISYEELVHVSLWFPSLSSFQPRIPKERKLEILMDIMNKQQLQIAELVKANAGTASPELLAQAEATSVETHHQLQMMLGLDPNKVSGTPKINCFHRFA